MKGKQAHREELKGLLKGFQNFKNRNPSLGLVNEDKYKSSGTAKHGLRKEKRNDVEKLLQQATSKDLENGARKFSKNLFKDPSAISSTQAELNKQKLTLKRIRKHSPISRIPVPTNKYANYNKSSDNFLRESPASSLLSIEKIYQGSSQAISETRIKIFQSKTSNNNSSNSDSDIDSRKTILTQQQYNNQIREILAEENIILARNPSSIKLSDIKESGQVNISQLNCYIWMLKIISSLLLVSGFGMLVFLIIISTNSATVDFFRDYMLRNRITFILILGGFSFPIIAGIYCLFALSNLSHIRPYLLRMPFAACVPVGLLVSSSFYLKAIPSLMEPYLKIRMSEYLSSFDAKNTWDILQNLFSCCGIYSSNEWVEFLTITGEPKYPKSCCKNTEDVGCSGVVLYSKGCANPVKDFNIWLGTFIVILSAVQIFLLMGSICVMIFLNNLIKNSIDDPRKSCKIIMGKCYSICESVENDRQQELIEQRQNYFKNLVKNMPT